MQKFVNLNSDIGESFGAYKMGFGRRIITVSPKEASWHGLFMEIRQPSLHGLYSRN